MAMTQEPKKLEVPTIYKAYVREYPNKILFFFPQRVALVFFPLRKLGQCPLGGKLGSARMPGRQ